MEMARKLCLNGRRDENTEGQPDNQLDCFMSAFEGIHLRQFNENQFVNLICKRMKSIEKQIVP